MIDIKGVQSDLEEFHHLAKSIDKMRLKMRMMTAIGWLEQALEELEAARRVVEAARKLQTKRDAWHPPTASVMQGPAFELRTALAAYDLARGGSNAD